MKRTLGTSVLLLLTAMSAACSFSVLEDIGSDPHPPTVLITTIVHYVEPETPEEPPPEPATPAADAARSSPRGRAITWDSGGFSVGPGQLFQLGLSYTDAGGDIEKFRIRDRDGALNLDLTPTESAYFSGTVGTAFGPADGIEITGILGPHRLELWAEDSHGSRSEKVEFTVTLTL